jgi:glycosyltransferase involved in cell wall biosynthesis
MDNLFIIYHRSSHHASKSGYGRLIDFLNARVIYGTTNFPFRIAKIVTKFYSNKKGSFNTVSLLKLIELYFLLKKNKRKKNIVHFLNGERDIRHLSFFKRNFPNTYFFATFHKPPEILEKTITDNSSLKKLDGIIGVGVNQIEFLKEWLKTNNVLYIPHGIDTNYFNNESIRINDHTLLFVGQHLRDFEALNFCVPKVAEKIPDLKVYVILHRSYKKYVEPHKSIKVYSDINDSDLKVFYQKATALFLPMLNSTACNSILEAMAMGLPIISSDVGGNYGYVNESNAILAPKGKNDFLIDASIELLKNEDKLNQMGIKSLELSNQFDWKNIAIQINEFYSYCIIN